MKTKEWVDDLIWCPSQCYYYFETMSGRRFCIYLRWRHSDPWTADLVEFPVNTWNWDNSTWTEIVLSKDYIDTELEQLKLEVLKQVFSTFKSDKIKKREDMIL